MSKLTEFLKSRSKPVSLPRTRKNKKLVHGVHTRLSGRVQNVQVIEVDGSVSWESGSFDNLILDQGLNQIATNQIGNCFANCAVGTGNTVPAVAQIGLAAEAARTANYLTGAGNCGTTRTTVTQWVMRRTFNFPIGALNGNYTELGFSPIATAGSNLFSRVLIKSGGIDTAVTVTSTQSLRVIYELTINFSSADQVFSSNFGGNWGLINGTGRLQNTTPNIQSTALCSVLTTGLSDLGGSQFPSLEPSISSNISVSDSAQALGTLGGNTSYSGTIFSLSATAANYTNNSFFRDRSVTFDTTQANQTIRSIFLVNILQSGFPGWAMLLSANQIKTNLATLTLTFRISWGR